jgi:hypothetical protein
MSVPGVTTDCQHVVLTRFNVDIGPHRRAWDDAWLAARLDLFEAYCLPSMLDQTEQRFTWLVFFAASSRPTIERFLDRLPPMPNLRPVYTTGVFCPATARAAVAGVHDGCSATVLTTRLDCDDALRADVVARVQAVTRQRSVEVLNFPLGYQVADGRFHLAFDPANAFCTLLEPWSPADLRTVYCAQHQAIASVAPVRQVDWSPSWLQIIHGANLANKANGVRVGRRRAVSRFANLPGIAALRDDERTGELLADTFRTASRVAAKAVTRRAGRRRVRALFPTRSS